MEEKELNLSDIGKTPTKELKHHGVKGMKWGVTKSVAKGVSESANEASTALNGKVSVTKKHKRKLANMSDAELQSRINRQTNEQKYAALNPTRIQRGRQRASSVLKTVGSLAAITASVAGTVYFVKNMK